MALADVRPNLPTNGTESAAHRITTGPISGSRKVYTAAPSPA